MSLHGLASVSSSARYHIVLQWLHCELKQNTEKTTRVQITDNFSL